MEFELLMEYNFQPENQSNDEGNDEENHQIASKSFKRFKIVIVTWIFEAIRITFPNFQFEYQRVLTVLKPTKYQAIVMEKTKISVLLVVSLLVLESSQTQTTRFKNLMCLPDNNTIKIDYCRVRVYSRTCSAFVVKGSVKELVKPFHVRENLRKFCETSMTFDHFR
jgi:hypothetical protein